MATCDPDGRIGQALIFDPLACLAMEMNESIADAVAKFEALLPDEPDDV